MRKARKWLLLTVLKIANFQQVRKSISNFRQKLAKWQNLPKLIYLTRICLFRRLLLWWRNTQKFSHSCSRATAKFIHDQNIFSSFSQGTTSEWRRKWVCPTKQNEPHDSIHVQSLRIKLNVKIGLLLFRLLVFLAAVNNSNSQALNS